MLSSTDDNVLPVIACAWRRDHGMLSPMPPLRHTVSPSLLGLWSAFLALTLFNPLLLLPVSLQDGCTPLHCAAMYGHLESVRLLVDRGADKGAKSNVRWKSDTGCRQD